MSPFLLLVGVCLDLFVVGQFLILYWLGLQIFPLVAMLILLMGLSLFHGMVLFDGFLFQKTGIRLEIGYLRFAKSIRSFWDSGREGKFFLFFPVQLAIMAVQTFAWLSADDFSPSPLGFWAFMGLLAVALIFYKTSSARAQYCLAPLILVYERWFFEKWVARFDHESSEVYKNREVFHPENEIKEYLSQQFPLLKLTQGFTGEKAFHLDMPERPNVVLVFLESFRALEVGALGSSLGLTPNFDRLASQGVLFNQFYSNSVKTSRCVLASLFGIPSDVDGSGISNQVHSPYISLGDLMQQKGYHSAYLHNGALKIENQRAFFTNHGYQSVMGRAEIMSLFPEAESTSWGVHDEHLVRYAHDWIEKRESEDPFFLTIFTVSNHHPWKLPKELDDGKPIDVKTCYERYKKTFSYTDRCLGELVDGIQALDLKRPTLFVILGDHGYPMGEHGSNNPHSGLYEEQIRVPLLLYGKGITTHPAVINTPCSQLDLMPTVMDLLNIQGVNHAIGSSLVRVRSEPSAFFHNPYMYRFFGMRKGKYKCVYMKNLDEIHLYDLETDPQEMVNIASQHPEIVAEMGKSLRDYARGILCCYEKKKIMPTSEEERRLIIPAAEI